MGFSYAEEQAAVMYPDYHLDFGSLPFPDFITKFHATGGSGPSRKGFMELKLIGLTTLRAVVRMMTSLVMALAMRMLAKAGKTMIVATVQTNYYIRVQCLS